MRECITAQAVLQNVRQLRITIRYVQCFATIIIVDREATGHSALVLGLGETYRRLMSIIIASVEGTTP